MIHGNVSKMAEPNRNVRLSAFSAGSPELWHSRLRRECFQRLRQSRSEAIAKSRASVSRLIRETASPYPTELGFEDTDFFVALEEELMRELGLPDSDQDSPPPSPPPSDSILCPFCLVRPLQQSSNLFQCSCGGQIFSSSSGETAVAALQESLSRRFAEHGLSCPLPPRALKRADQILIQCSRCSFSRSL